MKMKILVLNGGKYSSPEGGVVRFKNLIAKSGKHDVVWVDPIYYRETYDEEELEKEKEKNVFVIKGKKASKNRLVELIQREKHFLKAVKENDFDVCVFYNAWGTTLARAEVRRLGKPLVFDYIDLMHAFRKNPFEKHASRFITKSALRKSDLIISTATRLFEDASKYDKNVVLIPNGVNVTDFEKAAPKKLLHPCVGFVGGFGSWVDFDLVLESARLLPHVTFYLVGDGPQRKSAEAKAKEWGLNNVLFPGFVAPKNVKDWLAAFDVCLLPFKVNELTAAVSPIKLFEYFSLKKPVVATPTYEVEKTASEGCLFASSAVEYASEISRLLDDKALSKKIGEKGYAIAKKHDWNILGKKFVGELEKCCRR